MLSIPLSSLSTETEKHLAGQQALVDTQMSYKDKIDKADARWGNKKGSNAGRDAFQEIENKLVELAIGKKYCHYCEHARIVDEHNKPDSDIEHFYPKTHFPSKAFVWENFLYVCKDCNSFHKGKGAKFQVFDNNGNTIELQSGKGRDYIIPPSDESVLINPRTENPMDILFLNLPTGAYILHPSLAYNDNAKIRFDYTVREVLKLNAYAADRRESYDTFVQCLRAYVCAKQSVSTLELNHIRKGLLSVMFRPFTSHQFKKRKAAVCKDIRTSIPLRKHQTVWEEMKRQRKTINGLHQLFTQAPEALNW